MHSAFFFALLLCSGAHWRALAKSGSPSSGSGSDGFDIWIGPNGCKQPPTGVYFVNNFPSSPFLFSRSQVFARPFENPAQASFQSVANAQNPNYKMDFFEIDITEDFVDLGIPQCKGKLTPMLRYNHQSPGPLVQGQVGRQLTVRFNNLINPDSVDYPDLEKWWGPGYTRKNLCQERARRALNPIPGRGRATTVHHHGLRSLAPYDGWAEDVSCYGESKDYVVSRDNAATYWYHDHALGTTSENVHAGLAGMQLIHPCREPFGLTGVPMHVLQLSDTSLDAKCHLLYDRINYHHDDLYGDINLVNGIPWPRFTTRPQTVRFRTLIATESRSYTLKIVDNTGRNVAHDICFIVGADGGFSTEAKRFPLGGLHSATAYRWDIVCDFSAFAGTSLYLYNAENKDLADGHEPFFCYSHLVMRIDVSLTAPITMPVNLNSATNKAVLLPPYPKINVADTPAQDHVGKTLKTETYNELVRRAANQEPDRVIKFVKNGGDWLMKDASKRPAIPYNQNGVGWDTNVPAAVPRAQKRLIFDDIGQNTIEIWELQSGGGWVHPVHVHLIDFYVLSYEDEPVPQYLVRMPKDVITVGGSLRSIKVAARFGPNKGKYMFHCHNAVHEDRDMMRAFLVTNVTEGRTKLTVLNRPDLYKDEGEGYIEGDSVDQPSARPRPNREPLPTAAQKYVNMNLYDTHYPLLSRETTLERFNLLKDPTVNPWLAPICTA